MVQSTDIITPVFLTSLKYVGSHPEPPGREYAEATLRFPRASPKQLVAGVVEIGSSSHYLTTRIRDRATGLSSVTGSSVRLRRQQASILLAWANARLVWYAGVNSNQLTCFPNESRRAGAGVFTTPFIPPWLSAPCVLLHGIARPSGPIEIPCYIYSTLNAVKFLM